MVHANCLSLEGKIQYAKLPQDLNMMQIKLELCSRNINFNTNKWKEMLDLIKKDENDKKYFKPVIPIKYFDVMK